MDVRESSDLVESDAVEREGDVHEADGGDARKGDLELVGLGHRARRQLKEVAG